VDYQLQEFKSPYRRHMQRKAVIGVVSGLMSCIPFAGAALSRTLDTVVDLSSVAEVVSVAIELVGDHKRLVEVIQDKSGKWAERPLKEAVREHCLRAPEVAALGLIQMINAMDDGRALRELNALFAERPKSEDVSEGISPEFVNFNKSDDLPVPMRNGNEKSLFSWVQGFWRAAGAQGKSKLWQQ